MKFFAVIDTNVIVSALLKWDSVPGLVLQSVFEERVVPVVNAQILEEYKVVLNREKFGFAKERIAETITQIESLSVHESQLASIVEDMPDPKDVVFYSVALAHGNVAETHLITGNVKHFPKSPIVVTPREFLEIIGLFTQTMLVNEARWLFDVYGANPGWNAFLELRGQAQRGPAAGMTLDEINAEIAAAHSGK